MLEVNKKEINAQLVRNQQERVLVAAGKMPPEFVFKNATYVNVFTNELECGDIAIHKGVIVGIGDYSLEGYETGSGDEEHSKFIDCTDKIICPGFIDGHIHIESSMLAPWEFAATVVPHGTTAVITDPHEIANVAGTEGIDYMLKTSDKLPMDIYVMLPSCVPATSMDESGANLEAEDLAKYMDNDRVLGLAELMNSYGTILGDENIFRKIALANEYNKIIDGHAPGLQDKGLNAYITAGVTSDHECSTAEDAASKLKRGQWIMIREGTAAKNMDALMPLFEEPYCNRCMLVTDDKHPGDMIHLGHLDYLIRKAIKNGADPIRAIKMATKQPAEYFGLKNVGAIAPGYKADIVLLDNLHDVTVAAVFKEGRLVAENNELSNNSLCENKADLKLDTNYDKVYHSFHLKELVPSDFVIQEKGNFMRVIELIPGELLTRELVLPNINLEDQQDIIKLAVIERHNNTGHIGLGLLKGYGIKNGAVASSIAHDSHNLIIAGTNDEDMCIAGNCVRKNQGGIAIVSEGIIIGELALPIAGLMCEEKAEVVEKQLETMKAEAMKLGVSKGIDPFMTLAFISLPVIPELRLTTFGLANVEKQRLVKTIY